MKIGILTFHFAHNYGAMLQAYALSMKLRSLGYCAEIIDYRLPYIYKNHELLSFTGLYKRYTQNNSKIISLLKTIKNYHKHKNRDLKWYRFEDFLNETLIKSKRVYSVPEINNLHYECIICGSDQIWNENLTGNLIPLYFCEGISSKTKKITYAASNGNEFIKKELLNDFIHLYKNFNAVSIREKGLSEYLEKLGLSNTLVLDPIFLLDKSEWEKVCIKPKEQNYVLTYSFNETDNFFLIAQDIARYKGKTLVCITFKKLNLAPNVIQITSCGPKEFLGYFFNADFILTNSFHGTAFSILTQKQFYCIPPQKGRERTDSILQLLDLQDRVIEYNTSVDNSFPSINYEIVYKKLDEFRKRSIEYLTQSI